MPGIKPGMTTIDDFVKNRRTLKHDADSMNRHHALRYCLSIAFAENRFPLFGTML
jgi:hypothetical protein